MVNDIGSEKCPGVNTVRIIDIKMFFVQISTFEMICILQMFGQFQHA